MLEIRLVKHAEEREQLVDLFRLCFSYDMSTEIWDWEYLQNPSASDNPEVVVALEGSKIVGARPFLLAEMWLGNERVKAAQHCDTMVHPEHRNKGIFDKMGRFSLQHLKDSGYALSYGFPGPMARPGFLKQGYRIVAETENLFRVLRPQKVLSYKLKNRLFGSGLGFFYDKLLNAKTREASRLPSSFQVEAFDRFTDELRGVDTLRTLSAIDLVRSESYLRWRFDQNQEHKYKYIVTKREERLCGYAVVSAQEELDGLVYGVIVDYLVENGDVDCFHVLINGCLNDLEESGCDIAVIWAFSAPKLREELLKHFSFKSSSRFPYKRFFGYGYLDAIQIDEKVTEKVNIYDKNNWRVTYAFSDMR